MIEWALRLEDIERFLLIFSRVGGIFVFAPFFGNNRIPARVKVFLAVTISLLLFLALGPEIESKDKVSSSMSLALFTLYEIGIGIVIAFVANLIFTGIQLAGHLMDLQMGFGIANEIDLSSNTQFSIVTNFQNILALILFLGINGHHLLLQAIRSSFDLIPLCGARYDTPLLDYIVSLFNSVFVIGLKIASPVIITIFLTNISLGMLTRVMSQMNIFMFGIPLQIAIGLLTLAASTQVLGYLLVNELYKLKGEIFLVLTHLIH